MGIRKPSMSAEEARRLANARSAGLPLPPPAPKPSAQPVAPVEPERTALEPAEESSPELRTPPRSALDAPGAKAASAPAEAPGPAVAETIAPPAPAAAPPPRKAADAAPRPPIRTFADVRHDKVQVFLSAPLPKQGVSATFERLCLQYPAQKALQMILRKALDEYEAMLKDGSHRNAAEDYEADDSEAAMAGIQTSRMFPRDVLAVARDHFDPLGLESARAFGRKLATAALAAFFVQEKKKRR